ncbi:MAG TPA: glycogen/starch/alpha-glucan family phosphorylase [Pirellulales bacterium]|nr:glycogen/starch/alpha-glucan family phosphorylase [Pirellulales bacterium]
MALATPFANRDASGDVQTIEESIRRHVRYSLGKAASGVSTRDLFTATALSVRDRMVERMLETEERYRREDPKRLAYLSIEYLMGQSLGANLINLGLREPYRQALRKLGADLAEIEDSEDDAALGNGGLGRLAAAFLDSLATLDMPAYGYGIHYEYGIFKQEIDNGEQREKPDQWLASGAPWEIARPDEACLVPIYGRIEHAMDRAGGYNPMWLDWKLLVGVPHDFLIPGYGGRTVNRLRLYAARASRDFDMQIFNDGDYFKAVEQKISSETITKVLYPSDTFVAGRELRLLQEYFLVACAVRDIVRRYEQRHATFREFAGKVAIQLNDTHPALAVAELMRLLVDEEGLAWEEAWSITQACVSFTNHTLAPEALEKWPVPLLETVLPRHLQIIYEINRCFLGQVSAACPGDRGRLERMSLIEESAPKQARMTHLAIVGSHSVNGVSDLHTELTAKQAERMREQRAYRPAEIYHRSVRIRRVVDSFADDRFCRSEPGLFAWIKHALLDERDDNWVLADFESYLDEQAKAGQTFCDRSRWTRMAILNVARIGKFSSDRAVQEYARDIWGLRSV